ncbi:unnamed protein product [Debaryomyces tyrocola]|nr:unnamed protein product [Debaryomyces tyrocola]
MVCKTAQQIQFQQKFKVRT